MMEYIMRFLQSFSREEVCLLNKAELARRFNCDPRTIDRYIKISTGELVPKERTHSYKSKLDDYKELIINKVDNYGCTAMSVYKLIQKKGYTGKYSIVADFVSKHKNNEIKKATIRFETNPGLQGQVDWKEDLKLVNRNGDIFKVNIFLMVLGHSRYKYIELTSDRSQNILFKCLINAFKFFDGMPKEILFDNMKTVVDHAKSSFKSTVFNEAFTYFSRDAGFKAIACRPYRPQTKGKVESLAKLMDRLKAYNEEFDTWEDLRIIVKNFMNDINNEISQATNEKPIDMFKREKEHLLPKPNLDTLYSYTSDQEDKTVKVNRESMIKYEGRKYSVPIKYIGERMSVSCDDYNNLRIYYNGKFVISHPKTTRPYNYTIDTAYEILRSDAMKHNSDDEILSYIKKNLMQLDNKFGDD